MKSESSVIAVVGGGSVGTSVIHQLARKVLEADQHGVGEIIVFEPKAKIGAGGAYQLDMESNILNTRAVGMSADAKDASHFFTWARRNEARWRAAFPHVSLAESAFMPRALFGQYLEDTFDEAKAVLQACGVKVRHVRAEVSDIDRLEQGFQLSTVYGRKFVVHQVVLTVGNHEGQRFHDVKAASGFFSSPYPCNILTQSIDPDQSVCIIGSSLSAIDAAVALADAGHRGKISMVSRNGRLPSVRGEVSTDRKLSLLRRDKVAELIRKKQGSLRLMEVAELLQHEISLSLGKQLDIDEILQPGLGVSRYLDNEVTLADSEDRVWQSVIYGLNEAIDLIWHALPEPDRREFDAKFRSTWLAYRVSFPVENARKVQKLLHSDQLSVYGGFSSIAVDQPSGKFVTRLTPKGPGLDAMIFSDVAIDATGYVVDVGQWQLPLVKGMLRSGLAEPHPFGGIRVDFGTSQVLTSDGDASPGLYALGSIVTGTYFWTNAMNVNCRLALGVVEKVMDHARSAVRHPSVAEVAVRHRHGGAGVHAAAPLIAINGAKQRLRGNAQSRSTRTA